jgi:hypothetical protein
MLKTLLLIAVGVAIGYFIGFSDAQANTDNIVVRTVNSVGGRNRDNVRAGADVDKQMESVEKP